MDTSVFTKATEPASSTMSEDAKNEVNEFVIDQLFPGGAPKLGSIDNVIITVLAATAGVEERMVRDWAYSVYMKAVKDTSAALFGAAKIAKMHQANP